MVGVAEGSGRTGPITDPRLAHHPLGEGLLARESYDTTMTDPDWKERSHLRIIRTTGTQRAPGLLND